MEHRRLQAYVAVFKKLDSLTLAQLKKKRIKYSSGKTLINNLDETEFVLPYNLIATTEATSECFTL